MVITEEQRNGNDWQKALLRMGQELFYPLKLLATVTIQRQPAQDQAL